MVNVAVLGAGGGIGQPLSLLLKLSPDVDYLYLYDIKGAIGVATDLSHINSHTRVEGFEPKSNGDESELQKCLKNSDLVVIPAGIPRKPGMTRADLFAINAKIVAGLVGAVAKYGKKDAKVLVISNPVNSTVPIAVETFKKHGIKDYSSRILGITTLDLVRAEKFLKRLVGYSTQQIMGKISVIGGHSGNTIIPIITDKGFKKFVLSEKLSKSQFEEFIHRVQYGGDEVVKAKNGMGSATLSMAFAAFRFIELVLKSYKGKVGRVECAFVHLPGIYGGKQIADKLGVEYFAVPVIFGPNGNIERVLDPLENLQQDELALVDVAVKELKPSVAQGAEFVTRAKL